MKKIAVLFVLLVVSLFVVACNGKPASVPGNSVNTSIVVPEKTTQLAKIQADFQVLETTKSGLLAAAQGNEACAGFDRIRAYEDIQARYRSLDLASSDFGATLDNRVSAVGRETGSMAYAAMKAGKTFNCEPRESTESFVADKFVGWMDKYGPVSDSEAFDPAVVRAAYLRALKPEIADALKELAGRPQSADAQGYVEGLVQDGHDKWRFSLEELGVPAAVWKKIGGK